MKYVKERLITLLLMVSIFWPLATFSNDSSGNIKPVAGAMKPIKEISYFPRNQGDTTYRRIAYIPPRPSKAAPQVRIGTGGTRSAENDFPTVTLLVPEHVAWTVQTQPTLYWHVSEATDQQLTFTLINYGRVEPIVEFTVQSPVIPGIHSLALADHGINLEVEKTYEWLVSILSGPGQPSSADLVAKGYIERKRPSIDLEDALAHVSVTEKARLYAENSLWYDALSTLFKQSGGLQREQEFRAERAYLLKQVGLESDQMGLVPQTLNNP